MSNVPLPDIGCPGHPSAAPAFHHRFDVCCPMPGLSLRACLTLTAPWTLLFGPSGSGKSSLLRAACGLLHRKGMVISRREPDCTLTTLQDHQTFLPPHQRGFRWAPQHDALFRHLTVRENIAFGAQANRAASVAERARQQEEITAAIDLFDLHTLQAAMPRTLSGGERRRVSLARAFAAPGCRLMLLDEPFNGIDNAHRDTLLPKMRGWLSARNIPTLSVTHNIEEALQLEAHVIQLSEGRIVSEGPAAEVLAAERERLLRTLTH